MNKWLSILFGLFLSGLSRAEYRVFEYLVYPAEGSSAVPRLDFSALPMEAYANYKNISFSRLFLKRTWMCPGHTGGKRDFCPSPYAAGLPSSQQGGN